MQVLKVHYNCNLVTQLFQSECFVHIVSIHMIGIVKWKVNESC